VELDIAYRTWSTKKTDAIKSISFIMLSKKTRNRVCSTKREYSHRLLDPMLPSRVLWRYLGVRNSGGSAIIFSFEELSSYYSSLGEDSVPPVTPADYGHSQLYSYSNVTFLMQSVELNRGRWT
jgi:hypothetical protein